MTVIAWVLQKAIIDLFWVQVSARVKFSKRDAYITRFALQWNVIVFRRRLPVKVPPTALPPPPIKAPPSLWPLHRVVLLSAEVGEGEGESLSPPGTPRAHLHHPPLP